MTSKILSPNILLLSLLLLPVLTIAQTDAERERISNNYNKSDFEKIKTIIKAENSKQKATVATLIANGTPEKIHHTNGTFDQLMGAFDDGTPFYYSIENQDSGVATRAADFYTGGSLGLDINGENMVAYIWDGGRIRLTHQEFSGTNKITQADDANETAGLNGQSFHAMHVAGTLAARGAAPTAKGMAPEATLQAYVWNDDINEINTVAFNGALTSNQSYGLNANTIPDWVFGAYISQCYNYDAITDAYEYFLPVTSAGNNGNNNTGNGDPLEGNSAYDKLSYRKVIKNGLTVANGANPTFDANGNVISFSINSTSSEGPTDDLRIKPDITGIGTNVRSCVDSADDHYNTFSGSSMAAPTVSGTLLLIQQYYNSLHATFMKANTLKGLVLHTAVDGDGTVGPDAKAGWGLINAKAAADIITNNGTSALIQELNLANGATYTVDVISDGTQPLLASISWLDAADNSVTYNGASGANAGAKVLVNDLDLRVTKSSTTYYPWRLTGVASNANDADNDRDPFERVDINNPTAGTYTITVSHKGNLPSGSGENFSLIVSGVNTVLSVAKNPFDAFKIYPNPTTNIVTISFNTTNSKPIQTEVLDVLGRKILNNKTPSSSTKFSKTISLEDLSAGVYFIKVTQGNNSFVKRIIKK